MDIKLYTDNGYFDLYPDETIQLKRSILSEDRIGASSANFTKDFTIPATKINMYLLGHYEDKSNESLTNPNKKTDAKLEISGVDVVEGAIQILSVTYKEGKTNAFNIVFYSNVSDFKAKVGNDLLEDVDWSAFEFTYVPQTITASWLPNQNHYIPIMSWDRFYNFGGGDANDIADSSTGVLIDELKVSYRLTEFVKSIFSNYGYNLTYSSNCDDYFREMFILPVTDIPTLDTSDYFVSVSSAFQQVLSTTYQKINMPVEVSDPDGDWDNGNSYYTPSFSGVYSFSFDCDFENVYREGYVEISAQEVGGSVATGTTLKLYNDLDSGTYSPTLTAGTQYFFRWKFVPTNPVTVRCFSVSMQTSVIPIDPFGSTYTPVMPEYKVMDFVSGFLDTFNLVLLRDGADSYVIKDYEGLYSGVLDLSDYADQKTLTYKTNDVYKDINFKHAEAEDTLNNAFLQTADREYGSYGYYPDVDYSSGEFEKESIFNIFPPAYMDATAVGGVEPPNLRHYFNYTEDLDKPKVNFLLFYKNSTIDLTDNDIWVQTGVTGTGTPQIQDIDSYSNYSAVQDDTSTGTSNTLTFGAENPFIGEPAQNTIFTVFYKQWLIDLFDNTGYTTEVSMPVDYAVYLQVKELRIVYLNGFYHYILEDSYDVNKEMITLKLLKVNINPLASGGDFNNDFNCDFFTDPSEESCLQAQDLAGDILIDTNDDIIIF